MGAESITLVGATKLPEEHIYTKACEYFAEKVKEYYDGPLEVEVHHSGDLGNEKDFFEFMMQGVSVDYAIVAPSWISTWDNRAAFMDTPFLWRDLDHWKKGLESGVFTPIEEDLLGMGVRILGYAGGGTRNMILKKEIHTTDDLPDVLMRVMGAPIQARVFDAVGVKPTPMDYLEVYNAIKTGVVDGLENEAASLITMKFYEVAPNIIKTEHSITVRPFCFSESRFQSFPKELQDAILKAGAEAAKWARETESGSDAATLVELENEGKIKVFGFDNSEMIERATPVVEEYAKELGVDDILNNINSIQ
jgi:TRAP-type C4-dicarboxylate transport system substrate-binding protein